MTCGSTLNVIVVILVWMTFGCSIDVSTHTVTYVVTPESNSRTPGLKGAHLTYTNASGGTNQDAVALPWKLEMKDQKPGSFLYVSAQKQKSHQITEVEIYIDGVLTKSATANEDYGIATASGRL